jgi:hypothetical protein
MAIDYLIDLEHQLDRGHNFYACPGLGLNEWHLSESLDDIRRRAHKTAGVRKMPIEIRRLVSHTAAEADAFLVVRKILEQGPTGEPRLHWMLVDTRDAAEMLRDVSQGPSPYFGATALEAVD